MLASDDRRFFSSRELSVDAIIGPFAEAFNGSRRRGSGKLSLSKNVSAFTVEFASIVEKTRGSLKRFVV